MDKTEDLHVTKLVDIVTRIPKQLDLHFSDFSIIFYACLKFTDSNPRVHVIFAV